MAEYKKPDWFDLENYLYLSDADLEQWYTEFSCRSVIIEYYSKKIKGNHDPKLEKGLYKIMESMRNGSFIKAPDFFESKVPDIIKELTSNHLISDSASLLSFNKLKELNLIQNTENSHLLCDVAKYQQLKEPLSEINLTINLHASDTQIISDIKSLLKSVRERYGVKKTIIATQHKKDEWYDQNLIPYLDIYIWAYENKLDIQNDIGFSTIAEWIPPLEKDPLNNPLGNKQKRDIIHQTTHKNAIECVSKGFLNILGENLTNSK